MLKGTKWFYGLEIETLPTDVDQQRIKIREALHNVPGNPLDPPCVDLCVELNLVPGIETTESCCGHGENPYVIGFDANQSLEVIRELLRRIRCVQARDQRLRELWRVECYCYGRPELEVCYKLVGPVGDMAYQDAALLAEGLRGIHDLAAEESKVMQPINAVVDDKGHIHFGVIRHVEGPIKRT
jgi:hypothetical protein